MAEFHRIYWDGLTKIWAPGLVNFFPALAYQLCLSLPVAFTQPGDHLLAGRAMYVPGMPLRWEEPLCLEVEEDEECVSVVGHLVAHAAAADAVAPAGAQFNKHFWDVPESGHKPGPSHV